MNTLLKILLLKLIFLKNFLFINNIFKFIDDIQYILEKNKYYLYNIVSK